MSIDTLKIFSIIVSDMPNISTSSKQRPWMAPKPEAFERKPVLGVPVIDKSFYNSTTWRKLRKKYISQFPLCEVCERKGIIKNATVVDHIKPSRLFDELKTEWTNLQSLCTRHHNGKSQIESYMKTREQFDKLSKGRGAKLFVLKS